MLVPKCPYCEEEAPYGDDRIVWLQWHEGWFHRIWQQLIRRR